jgi:hypothetical protein
MTDLQQHVDQIASTLSHGFGDELNHDSESMTAFDYLQDALDIEYIINSRKEYLGARVLVAFGGPNIWVDTRKSIVEAAWWGDKAVAIFQDNIGLDDALSELFNC